MNSVHLHLFPCTWPEPFGFYQAFEGDVSYINFGGNQLSNQWHPRAYISKYLFFSVRSGGPNIFESFGVWMYRVQLTGTTNETWNIKKPVHIKAPFILRGKVVRTTSSKRWRHSVVEAWEGTNSSCRAIFLMAHVMWKPRCFLRLVSTGIAPKNASFISLKQSHDLC